MRSPSHPLDGRPLAPPPAMRSVRLSLTRQCRRARHLSRVRPRGADHGGEAHGPEPARRRGRRGGAGDNCRGAAQLGLRPRPTQAGIKGRRPRSAAGLPLQQRDKRISNAHGIKG